MKFGSRENRAFTLIELMTVVTLLAVLSAIAVPAYNSYILRSRTAEAPVNIQGLVNAELSWIDKPRVNAANGDERDTCWITSANRHPKPFGATLSAQAISWNAVAIPGGFQALAFRPSGNVYYTYSLDDQDGTGPMNSNAVGNGYCLDAADTAGPLTNQRLRVRAAGDIDGDATDAETNAIIPANVGRYARIITTANGIPTVGPLLSQFDYE